MMSKSGLYLLGLAAILAGLLLARSTPVLAQDVCGANAGAATLGECKDSNGAVVIGAGATNAKCIGTVLIDASYIVGTITIKNQGTLLLNPQTAKDKSPTISTTGIDIASGGSLLIGGATCPIGDGAPNARVTFVFTGPKPTTCGTPNNQPSSQCPGSVKGIQVESGGTLRMYGQKGVGTNAVNWTYLSQPAGPAQYNATSTNYVKNVLAPVTTRPMSFIWRRM